MFVGLGFKVHFLNYPFQSFKIHNVILAFLRVVRRGKDNKIRCESIEYRRNGSKSMTDTREVDIFLSQRQQELLHINAVARTDVSLAVVEDQEAVDKVFFDVFKNLLLAVADKSFCAFICAYSFRETRTNERDVFPFILVRRYDQRATAVSKSCFKYPAQDRCLSRSRLANYHIFKDLTRRFLLLLWLLLRLLLHVLRLLLLRTV